MKKKRNNNHHSLNTIQEAEFYKSEIEKEKNAITEIPNIEMKEIRDIYIKKGFTKNQADKIVNKIVKNKRNWLDTLIHEKIGISESYKDPKKMGLANGFSFIIGGVFPILPFIFLESR